METIRYVQQPVSLSGLSEGGGLSIGTIALLLVTGFICYKWGQLNR